MYSTARSTIALREPAGNDWAATVARSAAAASLLSEPSRCRNGQTPTPIAANSTTAESMASIRLTRRARARRFSHARTYAESPMMSFQSMCGDYAIGCLVRPPRPARAAVHVVIQRIAHGDGRAKRHPAAALPSGRIAQIVGERE